MIKKLITLGIVSAVMCTSAFASPNSCIRSKLKTEFNTDFRINPQTNGVDPVHLGKFPGILYWDKKVSLVYPYEFDRMHHGPQGAEAEIRNALASCHCKNIEEDDANGFTDVVGYCWAI